MPKNYKQYASKDGCVYLFDLDKKEWRKVCNANAVPQDVKEQVQEEFSKIEAVRKAIS